jgi:hypothetical protein
LGWLEVIVINLSFWKYRNILTNLGGPIDRISYKKISSNDPLYSDGFESFAYLSEELKPKNKEILELYGEVDGTGFSKNIQTSNNKSISEALERWAYYQTFFTHLGQECYGYKIDPSTSGIAAFAEPYPFQSKRNALYEAVERVSITDWWLGKLPSSPINCLFNKDNLNLIRISPIIKNIETVLIHKKNVTTGLHIYGFASHKNIELAIKKAAIELRRNETALNNYWLKSNKKSPDFIYEKRLIYFACDGFNSFKERVDYSNRFNLTQASNYKLAINTELIGPWSKYAKVWRCVFEGIQVSSNLDSLNFFMF